MKAVLTFLAAVLLVAAAAALSSWSTYLALEAYRPAGGDVSPPAKADDRLGEVIYRLQVLENQVARLAPKVRLREEEPGELGGRLEAIERALVRAKARLAGMTITPPSR